MGTRGLVIVKNGGKSTAYYNQFDSYPNVLGKELLEKINYMTVGYDNDTIAKTIGSFVLGRSGHNVDMIFDIKNPDQKTDNPQIDYLFHEYVYVVDVDKRTVQAFKSRYNKTKDKKNAGTKGTLVSLSGKIKWDKIRDDVDNLVKSMENAREMVSKRKLKEVV